MTNKEVLEMVNNFPSWGGNTFTLAMMLVQKQREDDASIAESMSQQEVADSIRSGQ